MNKQGYGETEKKNHFQIFSDFRSNFKGARANLKTIVLIISDYILFPLPTDYSYILSPLIH